MPSADVVRDWFLRKIIFPRVFVINNPGFITGRYFEKMGLGHFSRHIFLPEDLFVDLEKQLLTKLGDSAKLILYSVSKASTWRFCRIMGLPPFRPETLVRDSTILFTFLGTLYANSFRCNTDIDRKTVTLIGTDVAVSRKGVEGFFVPLGALAGLWSYGFQDKSFEAVAINSKSRGAKEQTFLAGPLSETKSPLVFDRFDELEKNPKYDQLNKVVPLKGTSLKDLVNKYFFKYGLGNLELWGYRFFPFELGYLYQLEHDLQEKGCESILFKVSLNFHKKLIENGTIKDPIKFLVSFLKALGWGQITVIPENKIKVICDYFPWVGLYSKKSTFPFFRGALSAFISYSLNRAIELKLTKSNLSDRLSLTFEEVS